MEAKKWQDTAIDWDEWCEEKKVHPAYQLDKTLLKEGLRHQAEISFLLGEQQGVKKGMKKVVSWVNRHHIAYTAECGTNFNFTNEQWQAFLKKEGLKEKVIKEKELTEGEPDNKLDAEDIVLHKGLWRLEK